jgi:hypothetical protein
MEPVSATVLLMQLPPLTVTASATELLGLTRDASIWAEVHAGKGFENNGEDCGKLGSCLTQLVVFYFRVSEQSRQKIYVLQSVPMRRQSNEQANKRRTTHHEVRAHGGGFMVVVGQQELQVVRHV